MALYLRNRQTGQLEKVRDKKGNLAYQRLAEERAKANQPSQNGIVLDSKGPERDAELASQRPGIYRFNDGSVVASNVQSGSRFVSPRGRQVSVGPQQPGEGRTITGFDLSDPSTQAYLREKAKDRNTNIGAVFAEARAQNNTAPTGPQTQQQTGFRKQIGRFNPFSDEKSDFQDPAGLAAANFFGRVSNYTETKARTYNDGTGWGRVKALPFAVANPLARGTQSAFQYGAENPERFFSNVVLTGGTGAVIGRGTSAGLNFIGRRVSARYGVEAGLKIYGASNKVLNVAGTGLVASQVYGSTPEQIGAMTPSLLAGYGGFKKGFEAGKPGVYVENFGPASKSNIEYRYRGNQFEGIGTQEGSATVSVFGRPQKVPYITNVQVSGKGQFAANNRYYVADTELLTGITVGNKNIQIARSYGGVVDTKNSIVGLRSGDDIFISKNGKQQVFYDDTVDRLMSSNNRFVQLKDTKSGAQKTGGGVGTTVSDGFVFKDTKTYMFRSPELFAFSKTSTPVTYLDTASVNVRVGAGDGRVASEGLRLMQDFNLYRSGPRQILRPELNIPWFQNKRGEAQFTRQIPFEQIKPQGTSLNKPTVDFTGISVGSLGRPSAPMFAYSLFQGQASSFGRLSGSDTLSTPRFRSIQSTGTGFRTNILFRTNTISDSSFRTSQRPRLDQPSILNLDSQFNGRVNPVVLPLPLTPPTFPGGGLAFPPFGIPPSKGGRDRGSLGRTFMYYPEVTSILSGTTGKAPKNLLGFEQRPLTKGFKGIKFL